MFIHQHVCGALLKENKLDVNISFYSQCQTLNWSNDDIFTLKLSIKTCLAFGLKMWDSHHFVYIKILFYIDFNLKVYLSQCHA